MADAYDVAIIGGGIVSLATARALGERAPRARLAIVEKEAKLAQHQTGHNSGVIHSGIYYKPGSYKARLCVEGARLVSEFCAEHGIRVERCGKVIVATRDDEVPRLQTLYERGTANGVPGLAWVDQARLRELEPHAAAIKGIHSPNTAIVDFGEVAAAFARELSGRGVTIETNAEVTAIRRAGDEFELTTPRLTVRARRIVNCAGLYSDVVAQMAGATPDVRIIPFRGEYYFIKPERRSLVRGLIYPVPDPEFPFLGVHFTRTVHGDVEAGPNALLAVAPGGYRLGLFDPRGGWGTRRRAFRTEVGAGRDDQRPGPLGSNRARRRSRSEYITASSARRARSSSAVAIWACNDSTTTSKCRRISSRCWYRSVTSSASTASPPSHASRTRR